jgi:endonuclease/exonuclease/phosphatase (EEP) superfamily protein YafD
VHSAGRSGGAACNTPPVLGVDVIGWVVVGVMAAVLTTQVAGWSGSKVVVTAQAASSYLFALAPPLAVAAGVTGRWPMLAVAVAVSAGLVAMCWPLWFPPAQSAAADHASPLRVFHGNLLYYNGRTADLARAVVDIDADVIAFTEYTEVHAGGMYVSPLAQSFPYRIEHPDPRAGGSAIWSRFPLTEVTAPPSLYQSSAAVVAAPDPVTLFVVHPPNPLDHLRYWHDELERLAALRHAASPPAIVVGDFNATYWHPPFRRLLAAGWRDAHHLAGRGFSSSWPDDKAWLPPFLRLDHALVDDSLVVTAVSDVDLPGSDHRGLIVTVAVSQRAAGRGATRSRPPRRATGGSSTASSPRRERSDRTPSPGSTAG